METLLTMWLMVWGNNVYNELSSPPPTIKVEKVTVPRELYYPDLTDDMWDPDWINKKS